jgi:hypothetical protein
MLRFVEDERCRKRIFRRLHPSLDAPWLVLAVLDFLFKHKGAYQRLF